MLVNNNRCIHRSQRLNGSLLHTSLPRRVNMRPAFFDAQQRTIHPPLAPRAAATLCALEQQRTHATRQQHAIAGYIRIMLIPSPPLSLAPVCTNTDIPAALAATLLDRPTAPSVPTNAAVRLHVPSIAVAARSVLGVMLAFPARPLTAASSRKSDGVAMAMAKRVARGAGGAQGTRPHDGPAIHVLSGGAVNDNT